MGRPRRGERNEKRLLERERQGSGGNIGNKLKEGLKKKKLKLSDLCPL